MRGTAAMHSISTWADDDADAADVDADADANADADADDDNDNDNHGDGDPAAVDDNGGMIMMVGVKDLHVISPERRRFEFEMMILMS